MSDIRKTILSVILAGVTGIAQAGTLGGSAAMASADVTFTSSSQITNKLAMAPGLIAGENISEKYLADGQIMSTNNQKHRYALRISNSIDEKVNDGNNITYTISGKNNPANAIKVYMNYFPTENNSDSDMETVNNKNYLVTRNPENTVYYMIKTSGVQNIVADAYTIQSEAWIYNA